MIGEIYGTIKTCEELSKHYMELTEDRHYSGNLSYIAISEIYKYLASGQYLNQFIGKEFGGHANKCLRIQAIADDKVEIALLDQKVRTHNYFYPHPNHDEALDRFKVIINNIDWDEQVKQDQTLGIKISGWIMKKLGI